MEPDLPQRFRELLYSIEEIKAKSGRAGESVTLLAVSKTQPPELILELQKLGQSDFGENYAQELTEKAAKLSGIRWHFIGHLQSRKVKDLTGLCSLIHSVDSAELAREINKRAAKANLAQRILFQVHLGGEASKSGIAPNRLFEELKACSELENIVIEGLMTIPPFFENPEEVRPHFQELKWLLSEVNRKALTPAPLKELSMGMSHDYPIAIEEGATIIRVGTALFGERKSPKPGR